MNIQAYIDKYTGVGVNVDGAYGNQCWDLADRYSLDNGWGSIITGNGTAAGVYDLFRYPMPQYYDRIANTPTGVPQPGDIVVWKANGKITGFAGHIAIFVSGDANQFTSFDQNWPSEGYVDKNGVFIGTGKPHLQQHDYTDVAGWLHPKGNNQPQGNNMINADQVKDLYRVFLGREASQAEANMYAADKGGWTNAFYQIKDSQEAKDYSAAKNKTVTDLQKQVKELTAQVAILQKQVADLGENPVVPPNVIVIPKGLIAWLKNLLGIK